MTLSFYDDGVIHYSAPKGRLRKQFRRLERKLGLNFERVKGYPDAEIICRHDDLLHYSGVTKFQTRYIEIIIDPRWAEDYHVEAHEIGHALGLSHNDDCNSAMNTNWCYERKYLSKSDRAGIAELFFG